MLAFKIRILNAEDNIHAIYLTGTIFLMPIHMWYLWVCAYFRFYGLQVLMILNTPLSFFIFVRSVRRKHEGNRT
jgi:hypothetical protein